MIVRVAPPEHYGWIAERAHLVLHPQFRAIEALDAHGKIAGMVGFDGWADNSVSMHVAIDVPIAVRSLLKQAFGMAFLPPPLGWGKGVVTGIVLSTNERALKLDRHLGFREVFRGKDYWAKGVDMVLFEMRKEECRWLGNPAQSRADNDKREVA